jgi:hypothetical protein
VKTFLESYRSVKIDHELTESMKELMRKGSKAKMYKTNGSNSHLNLYFTPDCLELNCVLNPGDPVKNKWKLPVSEISAIQLYDTETAFA